MDNNNIGGHESPTVFTEHATDFTATYGNVRYRTAEYAAGGGAKTA